MRVALVLTAVALGVIALLTVLANDMLERQRSTKDECAKSGGALVQGIHDKEVCVWPVNPPTIERRIML